jgi:ABC-2 type transport system ATP-binding protein
MLQVHELTKRFPTLLAVDNLSFELEPGQVCGFVGPNGAGKTTTMRMLATLEEPTSGEATINGHSIHAEPYAVRRLIGFMPDHYGTYPGLTVHDYLEFYARAYELEPQQRARRIAEIMEFTGLNAYPEKQVETLSKGMRQRLNLGRALLNDPAVMIMDEPAAGLDPRARIELRYLIRNLAEMNKTVFVSSHILTELNEMCDLLLVIDQGRRITFGKFEDLQRQMQGQLRLDVRLLAADQAAGLERWLLERPLIKDVTPGENGVHAGAALTFAYDGEQETIPTLLRDLLSAGFGVIEFRQRALTMEDVFIQITQDSPPAQ